ncbi:MAG: hypothetical protein NTW97_08220 [Candidatus Krumholzibacteria bacterium]|nr:hypothetical protein [Candidatus Krumholzibacteria bacterium]
MTKFSIRALIALAIFAAGFSGCSQEGTLVIKNSAVTEFSGSVDGTQVTIDPQDSYETTVYIGKSLAVIGPDHVPVIVAGYATTRRAFSEEIAVKSGETTTFRITDDAGALIFTNIHNRTVNEIAARACGAADFGPNLLEEKRTIPPGSTRTIQLGAGCWDIQVNYDRDEIKETVTDIDVAIGQLIEINWAPGYIYVPVTPPAPSASAR